MKRWIIAMVCVWGCAPEQRYYPLIDSELFEQNGVLVLLYEGDDFSAHGLRNAPAELCDGAYHFLFIDCATRESTTLQACPNDDGFAELPGNPFELQAETLGGGEVCITDASAEDITRCATARCDGDPTTCTVDRFRDCDDFLRGYNPFEERSW